MRHLHFISGLPRAGTTLIASLLRQNPTISASIESPTGVIVTDAVTAMGDRNEAKLFLDDPTRISIVRGIFEAYYAGSRTTVFDNNRRWLANLSLLFKCYPKARVLAMVRPVPEIIDSFEQVFRQGAMHPSVIYGATANITVYDRYDALMSHGGVVRFAYDGLKEAFFGPYRDRITLIEYADLARDPRAVMDILTAEFSLAPYSYNFDKIEPVPGADALDRQLSAQGLHDLLPSVRYDPRALSIPPDLVQVCPPPFWCQVKKNETQTT